LKLTKIPEGVIDWAEMTAMTRPGESGEATARVWQLGEIRLRRVKYSAEYVADHWCDKGHVLIVLAGAVVLEAQTQPGTREDRGLLTVHLRSDGRHKSKLYVDGGPSSTGTVGHLRMEGREVFRHAVAMITDVVEDAFKATGYTAADVDWFIPHQANKRIIDGSAHKLGIAPEKIVTTVDRHGNTSAASIPLALADAVADRRIKRGDLLLLEAMGGGFTWGAVLVRW